MGRDLLIGLGVALLASWLLLVVGLLLARPKGPLPAEAVRPLPVVRRAGLDAVRRHWPGTEDGFAALTRLAGLRGREPG